MGENQGMHASFLGRQMSKLTNLNIRKQLKMTHLIGKMPPTTLRYVLEVMSGHGRPPAVFFNNF